MCPLSSVPGLLPDRPVSTLFFTGPGLESGGAPGRCGPAGAGSASWWLCAVLRRSAGGRSALALLVAQVLADHHDPPVTADHLALVADLLDARLDLHVRRFLEMGRHL